MAHYWERGDRRFSDFTLIARPWQRLNSSRCLSPRICLVSDPLISVWTRVQAFDKIKSVLVQNTVTETEGADGIRWNKRARLSGSKYFSCHLQKKAVLCTGRQAVVYNNAKNSIKCAVHITMRHGSVWITLHSVKNYSTFHSWRCW